MTIRYPFAITLGTAITLALLLLMQALVALQPGAASEPRPRSSLDIVRLEKPEELRTTELPRPDESLKKPQPSPPLALEEHGPRLAVRTVTAPVPVPRGSSGVTALRMTDGPLVAIVRVQPSYPAVAQARGLEGWVLVQFDVLADGRVANAFVVDASSPIFEKAALGAAYRFRFKPRIVDGTGVATTAIRNLFRFEMPDS